VLVHSITLGAGLTGHLTVTGAAAALAVALAASAILARRVRAGDLPDARPPSRGRLAPAAALVAGVAWARPHLFEATRLWVWDDYTYHMVYPARWLAEGAIAAPAPGAAFTMQAWYPLSASVTSAWFMLPWSGVRADALAWVSLTGVLYAALIVAGAAELAARLGGGGAAWALLGVLLLTSSRVAVMASAFSDADLAQAAALFAAFAFAVPRADAERPRDVAVDAAYAGLLSGIALGVKVSAAPQALVVLAMTAWRVRGWARAGTALTVALGWALTAGYWYARNASHTGNPVYPAAFLGWPGARFPETTLLEYAARYGTPRAVADALAVYLNWPWPHALLAAAGLVSLAAWSLARWRAWSRPHRSFAAGTLAIAAVVLTLLPAAPYSAGNALTFRSGFVHWDSMRYVAVVPVLGWTALGVAVDAAAPGWRALATAAIVAVALLAPGHALSPSSATAAALTVVVLVAAGWLVPRARWTLPRTSHRALAVVAGIAALAALVAVGHGAKAAATGTAIHREPLFGAAAAVLDAQPPGRVTVFGDQWIFPAFGDRGHLHPVRLDRDGRIAPALIGDAMEPGDPTVDPVTLRANLRTAAIDLVVLVRQLHPGRAPDLPAQHQSLKAGGAARLIHEDRAVAIWRLTD
jgi:hypothetical protein